MNATENQSTNGDCERAGAAGIAERAAHPEYIDYMDKSPEWAAEQKRLIDKSAGRLPALSIVDRFPVKLHNMLSHFENCSGDNDTVVGWVSHGRAFKIYDKNRFVKEVLPAYFEEMGKFASFQRQLNLYNFRRLTGSCPTQQKGYYHCLFLRGRPDLCVLIPRSRQATHSVRRTYDPSSEPDFQSLRPLPPGATGSLASIGTTGQPRSVQPNPNTGQRSVVTATSQALSAPQLYSREVQAATGRHNAIESAPLSAQFQPLSTYSTSHQDPVQALLTLQANMMQVSSQPLQLSTYAEQPSSSETFTYTLPTSSSSDTATSLTFPHHPAPICPSSLQPLAHFTETDSTSYQGALCWSAATSSTPGNYNILPQPSHGQQQPLQQQQQQQHAAAPSTSVMPNGILSGQDFLAQALASFQNSMNQAYLPQHPESQAPSSAAIVAAPQVPNGIHEQPSAVSSNHHGVDGARISHDGKTHKRRGKRHKSRERKHRRHGSGTAHPVTLNDASAFASSGNDADNDSGSSLDMSEASGEVMVAFLDEVDFGKG